MTNEYESPKSAAPEPAQGRWPHQVKYILGNEAAERFSFYGMKGILTAYITGVLLMSSDAATSIVHLFGMIVYFMPVLGAWVSDRLWGRYRTILWVSLFYCAGHGILACSDLTESTSVKATLLYAGLGFIAFGAGGIKPCVSAFMGDQFRTGQEHLIAKAYAAFYWMINLGSTLAFLVIPWVRDNWNYGWAFGIPGIAMAVATFVFWRGTRHYHHAPPVGDPAWRSKLAWILSIAAGIGAVVWIDSRFPHATIAAALTATGAFLAAAAVWSRRMVASVKASTGPVELSAFSVWWYAVLHRAGGKSKSLWSSLDGRFTPTAIDHGVSFGRIMSIFAVVPIFWALFDQTFSTWVIQGKQMESFTIEIPLFNFTYRVGAEVMLAANPILVLIFIPLTTLFIYPAFGKLATPLRRMGCGMFLTVFSYLVVAWLQSRIEAGESLSILWQTVPYVFITFAEVLVSTTGLEFAFTQAAKAMKSTITGYWQLTVAFGNLLVVVLTAALGGHDSDSSVSSGRFLLYAGLMLGGAALFSVVAARYRYREQPAA